MIVPATEEATEEILQSYSEAFNDEISWKIPTVDKIYFHWTSKREKSVEIISNQSGDRIVSLIRCDFRPFVISQSKFQAE